MKNFIIKKLQELNIDSSILLRYEEPWRFYHNLQHIITMVTRAIEMRMLSDDLFCAIVFHDIFYDPKSPDNEELSAQFAKDHGLNDDVILAILETKSHQCTTDLSRQLCKLDLEIFNSDYQSFINFEIGIFKEYQFVDFKIYKEKRIEILSSLGLDSERLNFIKYRKPNIAVYPGSFNPFHKGHLNILEKAEKIFDKVIIARGVNPEKSEELQELPSSIQHRQIENYKGLMTDFIDSLGYDVTLIRGLRNSTDLQYELTQYRFLQDLNPNIKIVSLFCDKEFEHISSSAIRSLHRYGKDQMYLV